MRSAELETGGAAERGADSPLRQALFDRIKSIRVTSRQIGEPLKATAREHTFVTAQPTAHVRFRRAIERRALWMAEDAARELPNLPLEDALQLVRLYAERGSPKFEKAALRWLERYLTESSSRLQHFAEVAGGLAKRKRA